MIVRLLRHSIADGPRNMAADEGLLESAAAGVASLRFYGWSEATLSLGYFQPERGRLTDDSFARLPWVRRPSGGGAIIHHREITYALALPAGRPWQDSQSWLVRMHHLIAHALARFGVTARPFVPSPNEPPFQGYMCFQHFTAGDLMIDDSKVVGSAQRRLRKALMQHGSILLAASPHAPILAGIRERTGVDVPVADLVAVLQQVFAEQTGWALVPASWTDAELTRLEGVRREKYSQDSWNRKR